MARGLINVTGAPPDANDGQVRKLDFPIGNRTFGQAVYLTGAEKPIPTIGGPISGLIYALAGDGTIVPCEVKRAVIDHATSGDNTIVAAVLGHRIRVISGVVVVADAVTVRFESGAGGTALTGQKSLAANGGFIIPETAHGAFQTAENTLLNLELGGAVSADGWLNYIEVPA